MISHATPTQIALHQAHKDRQARMKASAVSERHANQNKRVRVVMRLPDPEPPKREELDMTKMTRRQYARRRALQFGYTLDQLIEGGMKREFTKVKHRIMYELKTFYPGTSYPMIAEMFMLKDHSSVMTAVEKIVTGSAVRCKPRVKRANPIVAVNKTPEPIRDQVVALWREGNLNKTQIGDMVGVTGMTVLKILRQRGEVE